jgi:FkbM family methyltransferase
MAGELFGRKNPSMHLISPESDRLLRYIAVQAEEYARAHCKTTPVRILVPTSYLHVQFNRVVDYILAISLKIRGAEIIPVLCNGFHKEHCPVFAGAFVDHFDSQCRNTCNAPGHRLWEEIMGCRAELLTEYRSAEDDQVARDAVSGINYLNYRDYFFDGYEVGNQVAEVVANTNNLSKVLPGEPYQHQLHLHAMNAVRMILAYRRALKKIQPDLIVGSLHDHYQWSTLYHAARKIGLSYYSHTMVEEPGCAHFGKNVDKVCEVSDAWPSFQRTAPSPEIWESFNQYMRKKTAGKSTCFDIYPAIGGEEVEKLKKKLDPDKPVAFFPSNVPWDSAIHNYCFVSQDKEIINLIHKTVRFFNRHPEYQLIIKAHPYEQVFKHYDFLPHTLEKIIESIGEPLGPNIFFIDSDSSISIFDIYPLSDLGIVHSSRSGCEMAMHGVPVLLTGDNHYRNKGFTIDITDEQDFYDRIHHVLKNKECHRKISERTLLSKKYWLLYNSHGFVDLGLFSQGWTKPVEILFDRLDDFLPGKNEHLDYICDAILTGRPIFGENRWPPVSFARSADILQMNRKRRLTSNALVKLGRYWRPADEPKDIKAWADSYHRTDGPAQSIEYLDILARIQDTYDDCRIGLNIPVDASNLKYMHYRLNLAKAHQLWKFMHPFEIFMLIKWVQEHLTHVEQIIDIGANFGSFTIPISILCPDKRIIAVEPCPGACADLEENIRLNHLTNVRILKSAVGGAEGRTVYYPNALHDGWGGLAKRGFHGNGELCVSRERIRKDFPAFQEEIEVGLTTLDHIVKGRSSAVVVDIGAGGVDVILSGMISLGCGEIRSLLIKTKDGEAQKLHNFLKPYFQNISTFSLEATQGESVETETAPDATNLICCSSIRQPNFVEAVRHQS